MDAGVFREFGVEGGGHRSSLPDCYRVFAFRRDNLYPSAYSFDPGRADEDHFERRAGLGIERTLQKLPFADRAVELASVGIAADPNVDRAQAGLLRVLDFGGQ